ncbi:hypothetical protein [Actinokineospora sp. HUAS TT18]|uniref:hypothetical protein n=1 Tax=Actinokineospora sp. HUAS TT18 TaxID=3447451 RepID=UPI003F5201A1
MYEDPLAEQPGQPSGAVTPVQQAPVAQPRQDNRFGRAFAVAGVTMVVLFAVLVALNGPPSDGGFGYAVGRLLVPAVVSAGLAGALAKYTREPWPWWKFIVVVPPLMLIVMVITAR